MATNLDTTLYSCEACGKDKFSDEELQNHMVTCHVEGNPCCPFCDFSDVTAEEMIIHVNSAHLDYLSPQNEQLEKPFVVTNGFGDRIVLDGSLAGKKIVRSHSSICNAPVITIDEGDDQNGNIQSPPKKKSNHRSVDVFSHHSLSLNLNSKQSSENLSKFQNLTPKPGRVTRCPICDIEEESPIQLEEHINQAHFDSNSLSFPLMSPDETIMYSCPLCLKLFESSSDLELHVNEVHKDILSPSKSATSKSAHNGEIALCPVCSRSGFPSCTELALHIDSHFSKKPSIVSPRELSWSNALATGSVKEETQVKKMQEEQEFSLLKAQYGMDNKGDYSQQSISNMQRAVYAGKMSVSDYYERKIELKVAERSGVDDGHSCTKGLLNLIETASALANNIKRTWLCTSVDHYASTYGDKGWGCGYRNIQMLLSSLQHHTGFHSRLFSGSDTIPSISQAQKLIEKAWTNGFDPQGCEQLGGRLVNTKKWIGSTEVVTLLSSVRIRCQLIDFHRPTGCDGTHPDLFKWCLDYFSKPSDFKPPLYLQHQGHSRTVIGVEELGGPNPSTRLLVFDPSHSLAQMSQSNSNILRLVRKPMNSMKAKQYQMVVVRGLMQTEQEFKDSKVMRSNRIPQD